LSGTELTEDFIKIDNGVKIKIVKLRWILITIIIVHCSGSCQSGRGDRQQQIVDRHSRQTPPSELKQMMITDRTSKLNAPQSSYPPKLRILLPLYIYPNWYDRDKYIWQQVVVAAKKVPIVAIINPNSGPDRAPPNIDYQQGIKDLRQVGVKIVGYVPSKYANRDLQAIETDIDLYTKYFNVDGIFIDEVATASDKLDYYRHIYQYIKSRSRHISTPKALPYQVIINPGTDISESFLSQPAADTIVLFENRQKNWMNYHPPAYIKKYSFQHFAALIHTTANPNLMKSTIDRAVKNGFGYIYITNDSTDTANRNPWDSLPKYWQSQVNYIQQLNSAY
jgi:Spherulation-specific family 4